MTRILALETTGQSGSVAALSDSQLLAEIPLDATKRSAASLAPGIERLMDKVSWQPEDVEVVAVTSGPGSFTGLRVGVTTAKALAYTIGCQIVAVPSLAVLAEGVSPTMSPLAVAMDAQRGEVYTSLFVADDDGHWRCSEPVGIVPIEAWLGQLADVTSVTGPMLAKLADRIPEGVAKTDPACWSPRAAAVGTIASRRVAAGEFDDLWSLSPLYLRRSAAEEKLAAQDPH